MDFCPLKGNEGPIVVVSAIVPPSKQGGLLSAFIQLIA